MIIQFSNQINTAVNYCLYVLLIAQELWYIRLRVFNYIKMSKTEHFDLYIHQLTVNCFLANFIHFLVSWKNLHNLES